MCLVRPTVELELRRHFGTESLKRIKPERGIRGTLSDTEFLPYPISVTLHAGWRTGGLTRNAGTYEAINIETRKTRAHISKMRGGG